MRRPATKLLRRLRERRVVPAEGPSRAGGPVHDASADAGSLAARFDKLGVEQVLAHLDTLGASDLARLGDYERAHQKRVKVLAQVDARLGHEPWPGYDSLDVDGVRFGLDGAERDRFVMVLAYERVHQNRAGVILAAQQMSSSQ